MHPMMRHFLAVLILFVLTGCSSGGGNGGSSGPVPLPTLPPSVQLTGLEVGASTSQLPAGQDLQLQATAIYSNGLRVDVSQQATWSSSAPDVVRLTGALAHGEAVGQATITAAFGGLKATKQLQVTAATLQRLEIDPLQADIPQGLTRQFQATGVFSDGSRLDVTAFATFTPGNPSVAVPAGAAGLFRGGEVGSTSIEVSFQGESTSATLSVRAAVLQRIEVTGDASAPVGIATQFQATGFYSDGQALDLTTQATWSSSDDSVVLVSDFTGSKGLAAGQKTGTARVIASLDGMEGSAPIEITEAILQQLQLDPVDASLPVGLDLQYQAVGLFSDGQQRTITAQVIWSSSQTGVATISNTPGTTGLAKAAAEGDTTIRAELNGVFAETSLHANPAVLQTLEVLPAEPTLPKGLRLQFQAQGHFSDGQTRILTDQVNWTSAAPAIADVSTGGEALALAVGTADILAERDGITGQTQLTVTPAVLESISVSPQNGSRPKGLGEQFHALGHYSDGQDVDITEQATWSSSMPDVASISNATGQRGAAMALLEGSTTLAAELDGVRGETEWTVTSAVLQSLTISPADQTLPKGVKASYRVDGQFSDGQVRDLTEDVHWSSSAATVAFVSDVSGSKGQVSALEPGEATLQAELSGVVGQTGVTVGEAELQTLKVLPALALSGPGSTRQYRAVGTFTDGSQQDVTDQVNWSSDLNGVSVSSTGLAAVDESVARGSLATVQASSSTVEGTASLRINRVVYSQGGLSLEINAVDVDGTIGARTFGPNAGKSLKDMVMDPTGRFLYLAATDGNYLLSYTIGSDGSLTNLEFFAVATGPTGVAMLPSADILYVNSTTGNKTTIFAVNDQGRLTLLSTVQRTTGSKPGSMVVSPDGKYLYSIFEGSGKIHVDSVAEDGSLTDQQDVDDGATTLLLSPDGSVLYAASYNTNKVNAYTISSGSLTLSDSVDAGFPVAYPTFPTRPQTLALDPLGRFLYAGGNISDLLTFQIDGAGHLTLVKRRGESPVYALATLPNGIVLSKEFDAMNSYSVAADGTLTLLHSLAGNLAPPQLLLTP